mmetsp:Transcript_43343/g.114102  ORF Transcript_43343/g.114102 Transcript_43343/m.114102 type:complete len:203 (-) Transcript_43343:81-689(-)
MGYGVKQSAPMLLVAILRVHIVRNGHSLLNEEVEHQQRPAEGTKEALTRSTEAFHPSPLFHSTDQRYCSGYTAQSPSYQAIGATNVHTDRQVDGNRRASDAGVLDHDHRHIVLEASLSDDQFAWEGKLNTPEEGLLSLWLLWMVGYGSTEVEVRTTQVCSLQERPTREQLRIGTTCSLNSSFHLCGGLPRCIFKMRRRRKLL